MLMIPFRAEPQGQLALETENWKCLQRRKQGIKIKWNGTRKEEIIQVSLSEETEHQNTTPNKWNSLPSAFSSPNKRLLHETVWEILGKNKFIINFYIINNQNVKFNSLQSLGGEGAPLFLLTQKRGTVSIHSLQRFSVAQSSFQQRQSRKHMLLTK